MRYLIVVVCLVMIVPQVLAKEKINSLKVEQEIIVDGEMSEWTGQKLNHFYDKDISVSVRHNDENIYLLLATRNERSMGILEHSGLTIWLNVKNKSKKKIGFQFLGDGGEIYREFRKAKKAERSREPRHRDENKFIDNEKFNQRKKEMKGRFKVIADDNEYLIDSDGSKGLAVICGMHKDVYLIEMKIPFDQKLMDHEINLRPKKDKIAIGLEWMMKRDEMKNRMKQSGGRMGGGDRGGMEGGRGGGRGGMGGGGDREMMSKQRELYDDFWLSVTLDN